MVPCKSPSFHKPLELVEQREVRSRPAVLPPWNPSESNHIPSGGREAKWRRWVLELLRDEGGFKPRASSLPRPPLNFNFSGTED